MIASARQPVERPALSDDWTPQQALDLARDLGLPPPEPLPRVELREFIRRLLNFQAACRRHPREARVLRRLLQQLTHGGGYGL
jgi:hypothetical protein